MQKKRHLLILSFLTAAAICLICQTPAYPEFRKVNNCELARVKASVSGELASNRCFSSTGKEINCPSDTFDCTEVSDEDREWLDKLHAFLEAYPPAAGGDVATTVSTQTVLKSGFFLQSILDLANENYFRLQDFTMLTLLFPGLTVEKGISDGQYAPAGATYVRMGLGSLEGTLGSRDILVTSTPVDDPEPQVLGSLYISAMDMKFGENSYVTLYILNSQDGLGVNLDVNLDKIGIDSLSWGDADGIGNTTAAGYVGLQDTIITGVTASGSLGIKADKVGNGQVTGTMPVGTKYNHIAMADLAVGVGTLDTSLVIGDQKDFSGSTAVLGTLFMKDLDLSVSGYLNLYNKEGQDMTGIDLDVTIPYLTLNTLSWGDPDGFSGSPGMGGVGLSNLAIDNLKIAGGATIEMTTIQDGDTGISLWPAGTALVNIGLTEVGLSMDSLGADVALGNSKDNLNQVLGSFYLAGMKTTIDGGVAIHTPSPSTQGIIFDLDINFPTLTLDVLSWGDADGLDGATSAGYAGFRDFSIEGLKITGPIAIHVATTTDDMPSTMSPSFVRLALGTGDASILPGVAGNSFAIGMNVLKTDVVLGNTRTLTGTSRNTLGSFHLQNFAMSVNGSIDIGAH